MTLKRQEQDMREIDMAAYLDGRLTSAAREELERGLDGDRGERDALAIAKGVLQDSGDAGDVPARLVKEAIARYPKAPDLMDLMVSLAGLAIKVIDVSPGTDIMSPAQAGMVRNRAATADPLVVAFRSFKLARVYVHVENMGRSLCHFTVQARDPARDVPLENARAELVSGWRELGSNPFVKGTTQFEDVGPGKYDIIVRKNDAVVGKMTIQIAGT